MKNILVPIDFSPVTLSIIELAERLARCEQSRLWLIHVASPEADFVGLDVGPKSVRDWRAVQLREEHREIQGMALEIEQRGGEVTPLLVQGPTAETILAEADKLGVDMIIMGSHGHGALYHVLLGSISEAVLHKAACPVVLVPARAHRREADSPA